MNEGIKKYRDLLLTDPEFQQKLKTAMTNYNKEHTEEAFFNEVLAPLGLEYGISVSYDEFREYADSDREMDDTELTQIAGGKGGGLGAGTCMIVGLGFGAGGTGDGGGVCVALGVGYEEYGCLGSGS